MGQKRNIFDLMNGNYDVHELFGDFFGIRSMQSTTSVRVSKTAGEVKIEIDVPGSSRDDVTINIIEANILRVEWKGPGGEGLREFQIDRYADVNSISAVVVNGMLTIAIPKSSKQINMKKIEVK